jgi:hypothetical protein
MALEANISPSPFRKAPVTSGHAAPAFDAPRAPRRPARQALAGFYAALLPLGRPFAVAF